MKYLSYLMLYFVMQLITYVLTPLLPMFAVRREGWCNNAQYKARDVRLPKWLAWFDTPDNCLDGDFGFQLSHRPGYLSRVIWLYRNSLYGFKWTVLAADVQPFDRIVDGDTSINYKTKTYGDLFILQENGAWQYKEVYPSGLFPGRIWVVNFGWLLDDVNQPKALFMFSPRLKKGA